MTNRRSAWLEVRVGDLIQRIEAGKNFRCIERPPEGDEKGVVKVSAVSWGRFLEDESKTVPAGVAIDERARIRAGDLLMSRANTIELVGACVRVDHITRPLYLSDKVLRLQAPPELQRWLHRYLSSPTARELIGAASSGNQLSMRNISQKAIAALPCPLPPLNEQKRIADKLDSVLARVDACRERLDRVPAILKRFRQAVLATGASGELTAEWRLNVGKADISWQCTSVGAVAETVFDGPFGSHLKSADYSTSGVQVVRLENIGSLKFITEKKTYIPEAKFELLRRHTLEPNDLLFSSFVDEEVRVCLLPENLADPAINKADVFCVRTKTSVCLPRFLLYRLGCRSTYLALRDEVHGATRPRINLTQLRRIEISLPPLEEQVEIIHRVESLLAWADRLEARFAAAREQTDRLTPSLLDKALRGELVPQDPADEPAAELLARVLQSKSDSGADQPRRGRRPSFVE